MFPVHTTDEVRAAEEVAYRSLPDDLALMQKAALGLFEVVSAELAGVDDPSVLIAVGPGNNGGDGLFAGARLAAGGIRTAAWRTRGKAHRAGWAAFRAAGGQEVDGAEALAILPATTLVVDAVYGMGARPGLTGEVAAFAGACRRQGLPVIACDVPSGLDSEAPGTVDVVSFHAARTVAMGAYKRAHVLEPGRSRCGRVALVEIGLELPDPGLAQWEVSDLAATWPYPDAASDKYSRGVVGLDTGSETYPGAGLLSAYGSVYAGAGMVRALGPDRVRDLLAPLLPNVVQAAGRVQAWVVGSGWGERPDGRDRLAELLTTGLPIVVDADALSHLREGSIGPDRVLLTPHAGELAALLGVGRAEITADPIGQVRSAADRFGATVLLKGATQYVAVPGQDRVTLAVPGPSWTAQAGSGDVLAGICGTLLAAGLPPRDAALGGASIQALTAAANPGPYPPQDLARLLPGTIAALRR